MIAHDANGPLGPEELAELRALLLGRRQQLAAEYQGDIERERAIPLDETGDLVDRTESWEDREELFAASESEWEGLQEIDDALRRLDEGAYGTCIDCGLPVPYPRLLAVPWTSRCAADQEAAEARQLRGTAFAHRPFPRQAPADDGGD